jgi:hypothetical protein
VATVLDGGEAEVGWLRAAQGAGGIVGSIAVASLLAGATPLRLLRLGLVSLGLVNVVLFGYPVFVAGIAIGLGLQALAGGPAALITSSSIGALQMGVPDQYRGRVFGTLASLMAVLALIVAPVAGVLADRVGVLPVLVPMSSLA